MEIYQGHRHNYETRGRSPVSHGGDPDRRLSAGGLHLERLQEGLPARLRELERPHQHALELWRGPGAGPLARGDHRGVPEAALLCRDRQIILDVRSGEHLMGDVFETDKPPTLSIAVQGTAPDRQAARHSRQPVRSYHRARAVAGWSSATPTRTPGPARATITTSGSSRPTATSPGPRRCGSPTRNRRPRHRHFPEIEDAARILRPCTENTTLSR